MMRRAPFLGGAREELLLCADVVEVARGSTLALAAKLFHTSPADCCQSLATLLFADPLLLTFAAGATNPKLSKGLAAATGAAAAGGAADGASGDDAAKGSKLAAIFATRA